MPRDIKPPKFAELHLPKFGPPTKDRDFRQLLRMHNLKSTPTRIAVLEIFSRARQPLSTQEIIEIFTTHSTNSRNGDKVAIDAATVYRTIAALKRCGTIKQIDLRHNHAHYEISMQREHHHLLCLRCGRIEDVERCNINEMQAAVLKHSRHFTMIKQHALEFYGLCKTCAVKYPSPDTIAPRHESAPL